MSPSPDTGFRLLPEQASTFAAQVDAIYFFLLAVAAFFATLIFVLLVVFAIRYRRRSDEERPADIPADLRLEAAWTGIPLLIMLVCFVWGAALFFAEATPPRAAHEVQVVAKQWMWKFHHQGGPSEIDELHVPAGRPVVLTMISEDVIHSFYAPAFRTKRDVLPGRYSRLWFEATRTGAFHLFCAEYCGAQHAAMIGQVVVLEPDQFARWLAGGVAGETPVAAGARRVGELGCLTCHGSAPTARAPALEGLFGRTVELTGGGQTVADEDYLRESILDPGARLVRGYPPLMPTYQGQLSEEAIVQIIAYLRSLGPAPAPAPPGS